MIKVPYSLSDLDQMSGAFFTKMDAKLSITNGVSTRPKDILHAVFEYLELNLLEIITGRPNRLEYHADQLTPIMNMAKANFARLNRTLTRSQLTAAFNGEILKIFNYDYDHNSFTKRERGDVAYDHAEMLNLSCCSYCNAQFTYTMRKPAKTRPHFDHFFSKSEHPYFALSFYNLIPACYVCNSSLKGSTPFKDSTHLHPFVTGFEKIYQFRTNIKDADFVVDKKDFSLSLQKCKGAKAGLVDKAANNIKDFALVARYGKHKDIASELITKAYFYNHTAIKDLFENYQPKGHSLFSSEAEIIELIMGNRMTVERLHERIFSKLTRDICDEYGITVATPKV